MVEVIYLFLLWGLVFGWVLIVVEERDGERRERYNRLWVKIERETMGEERDNEEERNGYGCGRESELNEQNI